MLSYLRQSEEWAEFLTSQGWVVEEIDGAKAYIRKLPFCGSVIKIQRPSVMPPVKTIDKIAQKHRALFVKLEPSAIPPATPERPPASTGAVGHGSDPPASSREASRAGGGRGSYKPLAGFEPDKNPSLPTKTIIIDLTKSEEELWRDLSQDARQSIRKAESNQLLVISFWYGDKEFEERLRAFHQLLRSTGRRQNFWTPSFDQLKTKVGIFSKNAALFLAYPPSPKATEGRVPPISDQPIAGALNLIHDGISYGHLAASSNEGRKLHAPYFLMWEMVRFLKNPKPCALPPGANPPLAENPIRYFDLEGIYDPRYHKLTKSWQGLTLFKRKFGGKEVAYPQPLIKYYHPLVKLLFKLGSLLD